MIILLLQINIKRKQPEIMLLQKKIEFLKLYLLVFILTLLTVQCSKDQSIDTESFKVSGYIRSSGIPVVNANISLDSTNNFLTVTNSDGYFEINNVPLGNFDLRVINNKEDGSFSEYHSKISVKNDTIISNLKLPIPIKLFDITKVESTSLKLIWNKTNATDFREYKLYRHLNSGLDESTGVLVHVSTSNNDTTFEDNEVSPNTKYFYRIYVMNDYGRLGGSNIVNSTTNVYNYIINGDFEDQTNKSWINNCTAKIKEYSTIEKKHGESSLHIVRDTSINSFNGSVFTKVVSNIPFKKGKTYKLSCWIKQHGKKYNGMMAYVAETGVGVVFASNFGAGIDIESISDEWIYKEDFFECLADQSTFTIQIGTIHEEAWFDDLKLEVVN